MHPLPLIELANDDDLGKLARIEQAGTDLFDGTEFASAVVGDSTDPEEYLDAQQAGRLWVARGPDREPVGFVLVVMLDGEPHVDEIDVDPACGRRGYGAALLDAVARWAVAAGHLGITLTCYRDVPWNAPFYARHGFRPVDPTDVGPDHRRVVAEEAARGLDAAKRVVMRRPLGGG